MTDNYRQMIVELPGFQTFEDADNDRICADFNFQCDEFDGMSASFWSRIPVEFKEKYPDDTYNEFFKHYNDTGRFWFDFYHNISEMLAKTIEMYKDET